AVHRVRDDEAVPVDARRLIELVAEVDAHLVARPETQRRARDLVVVAPDLHRRLVVAELPEELGRGEMHRLPVALHGYVGLGRPELLRRGARAAGVAAERDARDGQRADRHRHPRSPHPSAHGVLPSLLTCTVMLANRRSWDELPNVTSGRPSVTKDGRICGTREIDTAPECALR